MTQNTIQFQNGLSLPDFLKEYGTEEQCEQALEQWRWPQGFSCPRCGRPHEPVRLRTRALLQCRHCHHQASLTAGTIFDATKLALGRSGGRAWPWMGLPVALTKVVILPGARLGGGDDKLAGPAQGQSLSVPQGHEGLIQGVAPLALKLRHDGQVLLLEGLFHRVLFRREGGEQLSAHLLTGKGLVDLDKDLVGRQPDEPARTDAADHGDQTRGGANCGSGQKGRAHGKALLGRGFGQQGGGNLGPLRRQLGGNLGGNLLREHADRDGAGGRAGDSRRRGTHAIVV